MPNSIVTRWLPCEIEVLCIGAAIKHFSPYIVQSSHTTQVLTDSKPCVLESFQPVLALLGLLEHWRKYLLDEKKIGALLMYLNKASDCALRAAGVKAKSLWCSAKIY